MKVEKNRVNSHTGHIISIQIYHCNLIFLSLQNRVHADLITHSYDTSTIYKRCKIQTLVNQRVTEGLYSLYIQGLPK